MNKQEYTDYETRVAQSLRGLSAISSGACPGCADCGLEDCHDMDTEAYELAGESHFSWYPCEICNRELGGDRYPVHAVDNPDPQKGNIIHLTACVDCYYYLEYGQLDDMTMLEIEES